MNKAFHVELAQEAIADMKRNPEIVPFIVEAIMADMKTQIDEFVKEIK